jgi:hypothetical protein
MLGLRFIPLRSFLVVLPVRPRFLDIRRLFAFVSFAQQQHASGFDFSVTHAISRSPVDTQFVQAFADRI